PSWTTSPSATRICFTVPEVGVVIGISIFIDSRIISVSSSSTACPTSTTIFQRLPTSSAFTSVTVPSSYRWHAVLAPGAPLPLSLSALERIDDHPSRVRGIDEVVDHRPRRRDEWVDRLTDPRRGFRTPRRGIIRCGDLLGEDDVDRALRTHDGDFGRWPRNQRIRLIPATAHHVVPGAVRLAENDCHLRHRRLTHRVEHLRAVTDDALLLDLGAHDEPGDILQEYQRNVERVAQPDEARGLVGGVDVECPTFDHRLTCHDAGTLAVEVHQRGDDVSREGGLDLEDLTIVGEPFHHLAHVVCGARVGGNDLLEVVDPAVASIRRLPPRRRLAVVGRKVREI